MASATSWTQSYPEQGGNSGPFGKPGNVLFYHQSKNPIWKRQDLNRQAAVGKVELEDCTKSEDDSIPGTEDYELIKA